MDIDRKKEFREKELEKIHEPVPDLEPKECHD